MPKTSVVIAGLAAVGVAAGVYWMSSEQTPAPMSVDDANAQNENANTVANNWQWKNFNTTQPTSTVDKPSEGEPRQTDALPYDAVEVYKVLQSLKLDDSGRLVPDQAVLKALEKGYSDLGADLSPEAMAGLQDVIRKGLPGQAGQEAAHILENYYRYRAAETEFHAQLANQLPAASHYQELIQLRRNYFGQEVADQLFAMENTQARHMLAAVAIEKNAALSAEEKQTQHNALQEKLNERLVAQGQLNAEEAAAEKVARAREQGSTEVAAAGPEEAQWQSRFNGYWQARRYVMQAGYDEAERQRQVDQLLNQYFSPEERERARATSFEWQARDAT